MVGGLNYHSMPMFYSNSEELGSLLEIMSITCLSGKCDPYGISFTMIPSPPPPKDNLHWERHSTCNIDI